MDPKPLSTRLCIMLILVFGIAIYSNTSHVPFQYDDINDIVLNQVLRPPLDLGRIWHSFPSRVVTLMTFAVQFALTGSAPRGFHFINLLIHLLTAMAVFGTTRLLLQTPALKRTVRSSQRALFALAPALLFLTHPLQTEAVTYIVQRHTSLATLFYLGTLWMYLRARLEDGRHYRVVFLFMLAAMLTKEISFTLPFAILLVDFCFFPVSNKETIAKKIRRWLPFAAFLLVIPLTLYLSSSGNLGHGGRFMSVHGAVDSETSRWDYLLTQFRVLRTYLRLLVFPVGQSIDYDYPLSSGWGDPDTWMAFSLLLSLFCLALSLLKKHRLLAFGMLWFFLTLSVESSLMPLKDVIIEHRLYLPMFGFALFLSSLLWRWARSPLRFMAIILLIVVALSSMTYERNEVWKSHLTLWLDAAKKSPAKDRPYCKVGEFYSQELNDDKSALVYFHKALTTGHISIPLLANTSICYFRSGHPKEGAFYENWAASSKRSEVPQERDLLFYNQAVTLKNEQKIPEAIQILKKAVEINPLNPLLLYSLAELYRESGQVEAAVAFFKKAIDAAPSAKDGYAALALLYKERGEKDKAIAVLVKYLKFKKEHSPLFGD